MRKKHAVRCVLFVLIGNYAKGSGRKEAKRGEVFRMMEVRTAHIRTIEKNNSIKFDFFLAFFRGTLYKKQRMG